jgi:O-antigen/teichoic acid export membrane protein
MGGLLPLAVSLVTIPIYISVIGESRYGVLAISWLLLGYFGLFDLGLGRATAQRIAKLGIERSAERSETFWTALALNFVLGGVGALLMWPLAMYFFGNYFVVEEALRLEILSAIPWLVMAVPIATLSGVLVGTLQGCFRFLELNILSATSSILLQTLPLAIAVVFGPNLLWLVTATVLTRLLMISIFFHRCYLQIFSGFKPKFSYRLSRKLIKYGGWVTVSSTIGPMMVVLDRFIIGAMLGAKFVTYYTIPFQLGERTSIIPVALSSALFPRLAQNRTGPEGFTLVESAIKALAVVLTPLFLLGIFFIDWFLAIWIGRDFADQASWAGQVILLGFWANAIARVPHALLQASGRPDVVATCHLAEILPYFLMLYLGLHFFGIAGAAMAFSIRAGVDALLLLHYAGVFSLVLRFLIVPIALMCVGLFLIRTYTGLWLELCIMSAVFCLASTWAFFYLPRDLALAINRIVPFKIARQRAD